MEGGAQHNESEKSTQLIQAADQQEENEEEKKVDELYTNRQLPISFQKFLAENDIETDFFSEATIKCLEYRYIRVKPGKAISREALANDFGCAGNDVQCIEWFGNDLYKIPNTVKIATSKLYKEGHIYGIDLSSAAVIKALAPQRGERVLDLCCAPGAKLCYIADLAGFKQSQPTAEQTSGNIVGVDVNAQRLNVCRSLVNKYALNDCVRLYESDGRTFCQERDFDRVLVDAECTHDGSIKHLLKFFSAEGEVQNRASKEELQQLNKQQKQRVSKQELKRREKQREKNLVFSKKNEWSLEDFEERFMSAERIQGIVELQHALLRNGFALARQGGIVVYSTCSFARAQNEEVVQKFLSEQQGQACLIDVFAGQQEAIPCRAGSLPKTVRFDPKTSKTGGMFIAKFIKY